MKNISTLIAAMLINVVGFSQVAITIASTDFPIPSAPFNIANLAGTSPVNPSLGNSQLWDYSMNAGNNPTVNNYPVETNPFFTSAGIDVSFAGTKALNASFGYSVTCEYDFNSNGVYESGANINLQAYELSPVTGSNLDSLIFPAQQYIFSSPKTLIEFPFTKYSSWHSVSSRVTNFNLTVAAYLLNNAPGEHRFTYFRNDSIAGWGKMQVYTSSGPSIQYDVLMESVEQFAVDSFYLNGSPASPLLCTAFQVTQGQKSDVQYYYNFYRAGSFNYLMRFFYDTDSSYNTIAAAYYNTDNITDVQNPDDVTFSTLVFPNPSNSNVFNIKVLGRDVNMKEYSITDFSGRIVQEGKIDNHSTELLQISFDEKLANGIYIIKIKNNNNKEIVSEKINLQR